MKKIIYLVMAIALACGCAEEKGGTLGGINGIVSDNTTGESVPTVHVSLTPGGKSAVTGSDGSYSFTDLEAGVYVVSIGKEGYKPASKSITAVAGKIVDGHILIERIPSIVTVDRDVLDFGDRQDVNTLSFSIVNSSYEDLIWYVEQNCIWIKEVKPTGGTLKFGKTEAVTVVIDREKLAGGANETVVVVRSSNGRSELTVKAKGVEALPALNTLSVSEITSSAAKFNAMITSDGSPAYTERGFVFSTATQPTLSATIRKITAEKNANTGYSASVSGLSLNTTYYVRAFATNDNGTAYGNEVSFTSGVEPAVLSTGAATGVTTNSAILGGNIIATGTPACTERGVCYGVSPMPTIDNSNKVIIAGSGTGSFSQQVSGLSSGTKYYARAYAKSGNSGAAYGDEIQFTTHAPVSVNTQSVSSTNITTSSAKIYGSIINAGVPAYTQKGICYGTSNNPTIETAFSLSVAGTGTGAYSADINNLDANTTYYACAYAINPSGTVYGNTVSFKTKLEKASVSTQTPTTLSGTLVRLNGTIISAGNPPYIERGFVCSMSSSPTVLDTKVIVPGQGAGTFSANFSSESKYITSYHVRAYVISADGSVAYGGDHLFFFDVIF